MEFRMEKDAIGEREIPEQALYGIHSIRAKENFLNNTPFHPQWYKSIGVVKLACFHTVKAFRRAVEVKYQHKELPFTIPQYEILDALEIAATEMAQGAYYSDFIVPAITGGAGTSQNMNANEILANVALLNLKKNPGAYEVIDPVEDANIFQSTNDVIPTSLHIATMTGLNQLQEAVNTLRDEVEKKEREYRNVLRMGYTQMQEAVPSSWGKLFSMYSDALSRDWWRVSKTFERIKVVNLGGSAIGTSVGVPRFYLMEVVTELQKLTHLPVTRGENLMDTTANHDVLVEVHAILKAMAVNMEKMAADIRILSSDIHFSSCLEIPAVQVGSSIMPGKVNPVIPEFMISCAQKVYANDQLISSLSAQGCLELNAYLPTIGNALLESIDLLISANKSAADKLFNGMKVNTAESLKQVYLSPSVTTALNPFIGYHAAETLAKHMKTNEVDVFKANEALKIIDADKLVQIMKPEKLLQAGFTMNDL